MLSSTFFSYIYTYFSIYVIKFKACLIQSMYYIYIYSGILIFIIFRITIFLYSGIENLELYSEEFIYMNATQSSGGGGAPPGNSGSSGGPPGQSPELAAYIKLIDSRIEEIEEKLEAARVAEAAQEAETGKKAESPELPETDNSKVMK